jgi:sarcosine oxidase gamma subunit
MTPERTLVIGGSGPRPAGAVDVTCCYGALVLCGPHARETFARFTAIDVRERSLPVGGLRPGSVARGPGLVVREADDRFLMLFGWALGEYIWTTVDDAARALGAGPLGLDAIGELGDA